EVQEWLNWQHWKCCERGTVPWVRIPPSPPFTSKRNRDHRRQTMNSVLAATGVKHKSLCCLLVAGSTAVILLCLSLNAMAQVVDGRQRGPSKPTMKPSLPAMNNSRPSAAMTPSAASSAQRRAAHLKVCGNPQVKCRTVIEFKPYDLPFQMPSNAVIYDTELFYAIILQSVKAPSDECEIFISERDREAAQTLFPDHKVFSSRCF